MTIKKINFPCIGGITYSLPMKACREIVTESRLISANDIHPTFMYPRCMCLALERRSIFRMRELQPKGDIGMMSLNLMCDSFERLQVQNWTVLQTHFMDNNPRPRTAKLANQFLDIRRMDWLARSPHLNPVPYLREAPGKPMTQH